MFQSDLSVKSGNDGAVVAEISRVQDVDVKNGVQPIIDNIDFVSAHMRPGYSTSQRTSAPSTIPSDSISTPSSHTDSSRSAPIQPIADKSNESESCSSITGISLPRILGGRKIVCPTCGAQLYKKKMFKIVPLTIPGVAWNGVCIKCNAQNSGDSDDEISWSDISDSVSSRSYESDDLDLNKLMGVTDSKCKIMDIDTYDINIPGCKNVNKKVRYVADFLKAHRHIEDLSLELEPVDLKTIRYLADALLLNKQIKKLYLKGCNDLLAMGLSRFFEETESLAHVGTTVSGYIQNRGASSIADALKVNKSIESLHLRDNLIGDEGVQKISSALKENITVKSIELSYCDDIDEDENYPPNDVSSKAANFFFDALRTNTSLYHIEFSNYPIEQQDFQSLSGTIMTNNSIQELHLSNNGINDIMIDSFAAGLENNQVLRMLILDRNNEISCIGARRLAKALGKNSSLKVLSMTENQISDEGAKSFAEFAIKNNSSIQRLFLSDNNIGNDGAESIAQALAHNHNLIYLALNANPIGKEGCKALLQALERNCFIENLEVSLEHRLESDYNMTISPSFYSEGSLNYFDRKIKDELNDSVRRCTNRFYRSLLWITHKREDPLQMLRHMPSLISDLTMMKLFYTTVSTFKHSDCLTHQDASELIKMGLRQSARTCICGKSIAKFKIINEKALGDAYITREEFHEIDNDAEVHRMENAEFVQDIREAVRLNTAKINGLESNSIAINRSLNAIRKGLKRKMKIEAAVGFMGAIISVISIGAGGSLLNAASAAAIQSIVDFGDIVHIEKIAAECGSDAIEMVEIGKDIAKEAINGVFDKFANAKLEKAIENGNTLVVVAATAALVGPPSNNSCPNIDADTIEMVEVKTDDGIIRMVPLYKRGDLVSYRSYEGNVQAIIVQTHWDGVYEPHYTIELLAEKGKKKTGIHQVVLQPLRSTRDDFTRKMKMEPSRAQFEQKTTQNRQIFEATKRRIFAILPSLSENETTRYAAHLLSIGVDSFCKFNDVKESDLDFMVDAHRRAFLRERNKANLETTRPPQKYQPSATLVSNYLSPDEAKKEVEKWLIKYLPRLQKDDVSNYVEHFITKGFDSNDMMINIAEKDLEFMKIGHRRALWRKIETSHSLECMTQQKT